MECEHVSSAALSPSHRQNLGMLIQQGFDASLSKADVFPAFSYYSKAVGWETMEAAKKHIKRQHGDLGSSALYLNELFTISQSQSTNPLLVYH